MAEPIFAKFLYCRPCLQRLLSSTPTRSFTSSSPRRKHGALPSFTPTTSPTLDALLSTFRTNIFLPSHLLKLQQNLIYKKKNHRLLTNTEEPATAKLGNEVHALKPLNHFTDEPSTSKSLAQMVEMCKEGRDWVNMVPFLIGLKTAGRKVKGWQFEKIVRRMGEKGGLGVVMEMARRTEGTGMRLGDVGVAREAMWGALLKCVRSEWSEEGVKEAEKFIEGIWEMLSEERHVDRNATGKAGDPKMQPEIIGVLMWIRALKSTLFTSSKDPDGKVKRAAEMVLAVWDPKSANTTLDEKNWFDANQKLIMYAPVWHGMKMARKIVGENTALGRHLANTISLDLEPMLKKAQRIVAQHVSEDVMRRGLVVYGEISKMAE
ncbi:MAG: hypothetical protein L6R42_002021 [Xanthoria sp. 1 TBL-2021]|nr:MAG: hypothetical protein L6R42_002021 [Xanthoria sp. 1 TBL-2021]